MKIYTLLTLWLISGVLFTLKGQKEMNIDHHTFGAIKARHIGPATMSGRIAALDALHSDPRIVFVGAASGGVWKSTNAGVTFTPVFDKHTQSIGAITIDQDHPDTVWVGTGEPWVRNSTSMGDGIYVSYDGGEKWTNKGLENTERIAKILIHPTNPDTIYVAALGHLWNAHEDRGVFMTRDGGNTWEKILYVDENTGCSDICMDPENPDILYAGMWDFRRKPYTFRSGGPGSGLYKSEDGGKTWKRLAQDLPKGTLGRIAVGVSPVGPNKVYALIESEETALYCSDDKGKSWKKVNDTKAVSERPFYFSNILPDPVDTNWVWKPGFILQLSKDGGDKFMISSARGVSYHVDLHALWISKKDKNFMYLGTDGGVYVSNDRGNTWSMCCNLPVSQFYHVSFDQEDPYNILGGLQDNGSWMGPSRSKGGINNSDWDNLAGGDGFYVYRDKMDPSVFYTQWQGGNISRVHTKTRESKTIKPFKDEGTEELRFNWNTPLNISKDGKRMYVGAQYLFLSTDKGDSWNRISPDLTTDDAEKQKQHETGGLTLDNSSAENHCTIYAINESPLDEKVIWAGTDDGNIQVSKDGGKSWTNVTGNIEGLPSNTWCSSIFSSQYGKSRAYATFDGHRYGDKTPYVYKTDDYGQTWKRITDENINAYCHFVYEDPVNPDLLYLATEFGLFVTIDGGSTWSQFKGNIPNVSIREIALNEKENDLILATHGRGIMIIGDITPLRYLTSNVLTNDLVFLPSRPYVIKNTGYQQKFPGDNEFTGSNPPAAAYITYYMKKRHIFGDMYIEIYNKEGKLEKTLPAGTQKGVNRVAWAIRKKPPKVPPASSLAFGAFFGPTYEPGEYTVKVIKGKNTYEGKIEIRYDPASPHSPEDRKAQFETMMKAYDLLEELAFLDKQVTSLHDEVQKRKEQNPAKSLKKKLELFENQLQIIHKQLVATKKGDITGEEQLREKLATLYGDISNYGGRPTQSQFNELHILENGLTNKRTTFETAVKNNLEPINKILVKSDNEPLKILKKEDYIKDDNE